MADDQTIRALAEQAYLFHLLVKSLRERGQLQPEEPLSRWNQADFEKFLMAFQVENFAEEP